jgi:RNA polymerase sigma-70 factor (sigma-E family)
MSAIDDPRPLAQKARAKRSAKLEELYRANAGGLYRLVFLMTGDKDTADDLVQEAFVRVLARFGDIRNRDSFEPYLRRAVINLVRSHYRRKALERRLLARFQDYSPANLPPDVETRDDLWLRLLELPIRQRIALVLRYYEDMSEYRVAEVLGTSARAVNALVSRGLDQLRRQGGMQEWTSARS